jgi:hypothetical protein
VREVPFARSKLACELRESCSSGNRSLPVNYQSSVPVSCRAVSRRAVQSRVVPCHLASCRAISRRAVPSRVVPFALCCAVPCHLASCSANSGAGPSCVVLSRAVSTHSYAVSPHVDVSHCAQVVLLWTHLLMAVVASVVVMDAPFDGSCDRWRCYGHTF